MNDDLTQYFIPQIERMKKCWPADLVYFLLEETNYGNSDVCDIGERYFTGHKTGFYVTKQNLEESHRKFKFNLGWINDKYGTTHYFSHYGPLDFNIFRTSFHVEGVPHFRLKNK